MANQRYKSLVLGLGIIIPAIGLFLLPKATTNAASEPAKLTFSVHGCEHLKTIETLSNPNDRICLNQPKHKAEQAQRPENGGLQIETRNQSILFSHALNYVCCADIMLTHTVKHKVITITELNQGRMCRCLCQYLISGTIGKLEKGDYDFRLYGVRYVNPKNGTSNEPKLLFQQNVQVK